MNTIKTYSILVLFFILALFPLLKVTSVYASDDTSIRYESINPNNSFKYGMKRLKEKIMMAVYSPFANKKADYYLELSNSRLAELKYVIDNKDQDNFELATKRYFTTIGQYSEFLNSKNLQDKKSQALEGLKNHTSVLESLKNTFDSRTAQWRFVQDDINYLKDYTNSLKSN